MTSTLHHDLEKQCTYSHQTATTSLALANLGSSCRIDVSIRLRRAILTDELLIVKRIIKNNPRYLHNPDPTGNSSLHLAAEYGRLSIVAFLIDQTDHEHHGPSKNSNAETPLMTAASEGHEAVVQYLATRFPTSIDARNMFGTTAMMMAAKNGRDAVVNTLLDHGAELEVTDVMGNTSLHYASSYGHLKVIRTLIERGAATDNVNRQGWTPAEYSFTHDAQIYYQHLVAEQATHTVDSGAARARAATPLFGRSEKVQPQRQRASSGS